MRRVLPLFFLTISSGIAQVSTELWLKGYSLIPTPRRVQFTGGEDSVKRVVLDASWSVDAEKPGLDGVAAKTLLRDLAAFHQLTLTTKPARSTIRLRVSPGTVSTGGEPGIDKQGYRLRIDDRAIEITGNSESGLFYGVQSLLQLVKRDPAGHLTLPNVIIEDWPSFELRFLHWDIKHHQDRIRTLKRYLDWAARFKINMIGFELEDKFAYPSHPVIGVRDAFTPAQLQEIVNYGLERFIQVVPIVQAPAHMAYVLKHPRFADLRADGNNYQIDMCDQRSYDLIFSMYDDLIRATQGVNYFFASTDEVYYAGMGKACTAPYNPETRSLKWVEFANRAQEFLAKRGRKSLMWVEYPVLPEHIQLLSPGIIDGIIGEPEYVAVENKLGIRQLIYSSMQGAELLFPDHFAVEAPQGLRPGRLQQAFDAMVSGKVKSAKPIGVFGAAWDDSGLHNETFWLGWSTIAQYGWSPGTPSVEQHAAEFMQTYYGRGAVGMAEIYRSLQRQARAWEKSWDRQIPSKARSRGYGNSYGKGIGAERADLTLAMPAIPKSTDVKFESEFSAKYTQKIAQVRELAIENEKLILAIEENIGRVDRNVYNLEVLRSLSRFIGHQWRLVGDLSNAEGRLVRAWSAMKKNDASEAVGQMVAAHGIVDRIRTDRLHLLQELTTVFERSRYPKQTALHVLDDTKDHWADRRADLSFMTVPEESMEMDAWLQNLRNETLDYAKAHGVEVKGLGEARLEH